MTNATIKSMKLYTNIDRILNELRELGKTGSDTLTAEELNPFDQMHYHGTDAIDVAIKGLGISAGSTVLEIGSGLGGPARHIASRTGARVTALELQGDQNQMAESLTARCGLADKIDHVCGDFLTHEWQDQTFDIVVSWLALYHIDDHATLLHKCFDVLEPGGLFYAEDLTGRAAFSEAERLELATEIFAHCLLSNADYCVELDNAGFMVQSSIDMSENWASFSHQRIEAYRQNRARNIRVHGENVVDSLTMFYTVVDRHFASGKLGGIQVTAVKPS